MFIIDRSKSNIGAAVENDIGRSRTDLPIFRGADTRDVPKTAGPLAVTILQEHGARGAVAGVRPEAHDDHTANHRICENGTWFHEIITRRSNRTTKSR